MSVPRTKSSQRKHTRTFVSSPKSTSALLTLPDHSRLNQPHTHTSQVKQIKTPLTPWSVSRSRLAAAGGWSLFGWCCVGLHEEGTGVSQIGGLRVNTGHTHKRIDYPLRGCGCVCPSLLTGRRSRQTPGGRAASWRWSNTPDTQTHDNTATRGRINVMGTRLAVE